MVPETLDNIEENYIAQIPDQLAPSSTATFDSNVGYHHFDNKWDDKCDIGQLVCLYLLYIYNYIFKFPNIIYLGLYIFKLNQTEF